MSKVRKFLPENKLAKAVSDPRGMLLGHAVQKANRNLDNVREAHLATLDIKMGELADLAPAAMQRQSPEDAARIYQLAREIFAEAGMFGLKHISRAAHSLCELMAAGDQHRRLWAGVIVHTEAISVLRRKDMGESAAGVEAMLAGLEKISGART